MYKYFTDSPVLQKEFIDFLNQKRRIVITSHQNPDGDAFGSSLGLGHILSKQGHQISILSPTDHAEYLAWMPGTDKVINFEGNQKDLAEKAIEEADLICILDYSSVSRAKGMADALFNAKAEILLVDHHQLPEIDAKYTYWNQGAAATCQLIYELGIKLGWDEQIEYEAAVCLYTGILTDTGSFRFEATTPDIHFIAGRLLSKGVKPDLIHRSLFDSQELDRLKFLGFALGQKLFYLPEYKVAYFSFSKEELEQYNSKTGDTEGIVNYGLSIKGAVMSAIFVEREDLIKISFRSVGDFSVSELSRLNFEGGGHKNAAGGRSNLTLTQTVDKFLNLLPSLKEQLKNA